MSTISLDPSKDLQEQFNQAISMETKNITDQSEAKVKTANDEAQLLSNTLLAYKSKMNVLIIMVVLLIGFYFLRK